MASLVDAYAEASAAAKEAKAYHSILREQLLEHMYEAHDDGLYEGRADRCVVLEGERHSVRAAFWERYRDISEYSGALREELGDELYTEAIEEQESIAFRPGMTMERIRELIGDEAYQAIAGVLDVKRTVRPRRGAWDRIARLHMSGHDLEAEVLHAIVDESSWEPQVRCV